MIQTSLLPSKEADAAELQQTLAAYQKIFAGANVRITPSSVERGISMARWRCDDLTKQFEQYPTPAPAPAPMAARHYPAAPIEEELPNTPGDLFEGAPAYVPQRSRARTSGRKRQR